MKFNQTLASIVEKDIKNNHVPLLLGEPGIGKSSWVKALAHGMHTKCFSVAVNQMADKADLTGARTVTKTDANGNVDGEQLFFPHMSINRAIEYANSHPRETPILFLDEINRTSADVTSAVLSLITDRRIGNKELPNNLRIITAGNDKGNITALDTASITRFTLLRVEPDVNTYLALDPNLNEWVRTTLQQHPECIFCKSITVAATNGDDDDDKNDETFDIEEILDSDSDMMQMSTPRTITSISDFLNECSTQELQEYLSETVIVNGETKSVLQEILEGHIGQTNFTTYLLNTITQGIMTSPTANAANTVGKPAVYDQLKACTNMTTLNDAIAQMSDNDKSGCLVYALYEKADNDALIRALATQVPKLEKDDTKMLMQLASTDNLDEENIKTFIDTGSQLANSLKMLFDM